MLLQRSSDTAPFVKHLVYNIFKVKNLLKLASWFHFVSLLTQIAFEKPIYFRNAGCSVKGAVILLHLWSTLHIAFSKSKPRKHLLVFQDVLKMSWRLFVKTPWRFLEDVLKTSCKTSWRRLGRRKIVTLKISWRRLEDISWRCLKDMSCSVNILTSDQRCFNIVDRSWNNVDPTLNMEQNPTWDFQRCTLLIQR